MAINNFISSVWSETLYRSLNREYVGVNNCSREFEGSIANQGDTVKINGITGINTFSYTKNTDFSETLQTLSGTSRELQITQAKAFN
nr:P22 coat protein - protein 5 domain protein [Clostridia bacterium]